MAQQRRNSKSVAQVAPAFPAYSPGPTSELQRSARRLARQRSAQSRPGARLEPTPEQLAFGNYRLVRTKDPDSAAPIEVRRNMAGSAIDRYLARKLLSERQHDAVSRYRADYDRGGYERSIISRYDGGGGSGDGTPNMSGLLAATDGQLDARARLRAARKKLPNSLALYFDAAVLHDDDAAAIGERAGRPGSLAARWVIEWIRICADELASYYRIP